MSIRGRASEPSDAGYASIEHTADIGVRAWGLTPAAAFAAAARGMYAITLGRDPADVAGPTVERSVTVSGDTWSDLLVSWLVELLFRFSVEGLVAKACDFTECVPPRCSATVYGVVLEDEDAAEGVEIKAVTYHQLDVASCPRARRFRYSSTSEWVRERERKSAAKLAQCAAPTRRGPLGTAHKLHGWHAGAGVNHLPTRP